MWARFGLLFSRLPKSPASCTNGLICTGSSQLFKRPPSKRVGRNDWPPTQPSRATFLSRRLTKPKPGYIAARRLTRQHSTRNVPGFSRVLSPHLTRTKFCEFSCRAQREVARPWWVRGAIFSQIGARTCIGLMYRHL